MNDGKKVENKAGARIDKSIFVFICKRGNEVLTIVNPTTAQSLYDEKFTLYLKRYPIRYTGEKYEQ